MAARKRQAGSPRNPRVRSTDSKDQAGGATPLKSRAESRAAQPRADTSPGSLIHDIEIVREKLRSAGATAFEQYLLREYSGGLHDRLGLADKATRLRAHLDLVEHELRESPDLLTDFEQHPLMQNYLRIPEIDESIETVAQEIELEVRTKWADRKNPRFKGNLPSWFTRADLFVAHFYKRWCDSKTLRLRHLKWHDHDLYDAYRMTIKRHPERDLGLAPDRNVSKPGSGRRPTSIRVPAGKPSR